MLKKELVDKVSSELSMQKQDVSLAVDIMLETMANALVGDRRTGKIMEIPDRKTLHFTMSKSLKEALISETE